MPDAVSHRMPAADCLKCGRKLDAATGAKGDLRPEPGSYSLCAYCGNLALYAEEGRLTEVTPEDEAKFPAHFKKKIKDYREVISKAKASVS